MGKNSYLSCCGKYYCAFCDYHNGTMVNAAKSLLAYAQKYGSLKLIVESRSACSFDEFMKGLKWIAAQEKPCKGCRLGGGWSWWPDCPVRDCVIQKQLDFCYQCNEFPCRKLTTEPLLERKKDVIKTNKKIRILGPEKWTHQLKEKYKQTTKAVLKQKNDAAAEI